MTETVPKLLQWARQLQAIAQTGVAYDEPTLHDRERYAQVQRIAAEMLATDGRVDALEGWFGREKGHATPKLDVRGAVFRGDWILLVREIREETGYDTRAVKLVGLYDRDKHAREPHLWHVWKAFFLCELLDEVQHEVDEEISEARFFPRAGIPELDVGRMTPDIYLEHIYAHREHPEWPTDFD